jgi:hypothetical protein
MTYLHGSLAQLSIHLTNTENNVGLLQHIQALHDELGQEILVSGVGGIANLAQFICDNGLDGAKNLIAGLKNLETRGIDLVGEGDTL